MAEHEQGKVEESDRILRISGTVRLWLAIVGFIVGGIGTFYGLDSIEVLLGFSLILVQAAGAIAFGGLLGALLVALLAPFLLTCVIRLGIWMEGKLVSVPLSDILVGAVGLIFGLIIANLLGSAFSELPWLGGIVPTVGAIVLGYSGWVVAVNKKPDLIAWGRTAWQNTPLFSGSSDSGEEGGGHSDADVPKIVDSSAIIDGRIADVCRTGFLEGPLVIPSFVLQEVQHVADSSDEIRRNRGRRGLDILNTIRDELDIEVEVYQQDPEKDSGNGDVDTKLLQLARQLDGKVITNDYNLNKVAVLQGVEVLNINDLANALKPMVIPGERMEIQLIKEGKEPGQGVGYLDDGTMVVVDDGRSHIGDVISVVVTSVLQTSAGRMIFARPEDLANAAP